MKNIHIIPTDKLYAPSRLFYKEQELVFTKKYEVFNGVHIYITSDEEIKKGDWGWYHKDKISQAFGKIILTTDQKLIKDGVQAIDDDFLEWFVKNPSCDEVEVKLENYYASGALQPNLWQYKIIIPKEEPKQETLEEAAEKYAEIYRCPATNDNEYCKHDIISAINFGAKWQQEQILQFLYSEITERRPYSSSKMCEVVIEFIEQFKKK